MGLKVAITAQNRKTVSGHAGPCRNYFVYTIDDNGKIDKTLLELGPHETLKYTFHDDSSPNPKNKLFDMDILLTLGIGPGGVTRLAQRNVEARVIKESDPDIAIQKMLNETLEYFKPEHHHTHNH